METYGCARERASYVKILIFYFTPITMNKRSAGGFVRGYLRFARFFNVNVRQWAVNERQCFLCGPWCAMSVNGLATAQLWKWSLMACFARCGKYSSIECVHGRMFHGLPQVECLHSTACFGTRDLRPFPLASLKHAALTGMNIHTKLVDLFINQPGEHKSNDLT